MNAHGTEEIMLGIEPLGLNASRTSMSFEEEVVFPTSHAQENLA
jgi:hypothetical protein